MRYFKGTSRTVCQAIRCVSISVAKPARYARNPVLKLVFNALFLDAVVVRDSVAELVVSPGLGAVALVVSIVLTEVLRALGVTF